MSLLLDRLNISKSELEQFLINSELTHNKWVFHKNIDISKFFPIYRQIILDGFLPTACVSGVSINEFVYMRSVFNFASYNGITESILIIIKNLQSLIYPTTFKNNIILNNKLDCGDITSDDFSIVNEEKKYKPLTNNIYICHAIKPIRIKIRLTVNTGKNYMNVYNNNKEFIPIGTNHSLCNWINLSGFDDCTIYHKINNNINLDILKSMLINFMLDIESTEKIEKEETKLIEMQKIFEILYNKASKYGKAINSIKSVYYSELKRNEEYIKIKDEFFYESLKTEKLNRKLSLENEVYLNKLKFESQYFVSLFMRENEEKTAEYISGLSGVSFVSAKKISKLLHEYF